MEGVEDLMRITWHGHSCFEIEGNKLSVVTDPHDGKSIGISPPLAVADLVLVSHDHFDHNKASAVSSESSTIVTSPGPFQLKSVSGKGIQVYHDEVEGVSRGKNIIFFFELNGYRFCHLGDLGHLPSEEVFQEIGAVDFLFIPVGGVFTLDAKKASIITRKLKPRVVVPMHYKDGSLSLPIKPVNDFLEEMKDWSLFKVGKAIDFEEDDIETGTIWLFALEMFSP
jgi:L-ascorbate metabolism protein UlaG (beta-lactamase superfamily)